MNAIFEKGDQTMLLQLKKLIKREDGATAIEYGLIAAGIALLILPAVQLVGTNSSNIYDKVSVALASTDQSDLQLEETSGCTKFQLCQSPPIFLPPPNESPEAD